jgi:hypothetical protein
LKSAIAVAAIACFAGCASFSTFKTARALDQGQTQVTFSGSAIVDTIPYNDGTGRQYVRGDPQFELGVRYGIVDGFDLGVKVWSLGGEINSTISIVRSRYFDLALAPSVGLVNYSYDSACDAFGDNCNTINVLELFAKVPLLFGVRFGPQQEHELVFGPEVVPITVLTGDDYGNGTSSSGLLLGGVLGVSIKTTPWLRIMPELTVLTPVVHYFDGTDSSGVYESGYGLINGYGRAGSVLYQAGLGFSWGGDGFEHPRYVPPPRREYRDYYPPPPRYAPPPPGYPPPPPPRSDD